MRKQRLSGLYPRSFIEVKSRSISVSPFPDSQTSPYSSAKKIVPPADISVPVAP